MKYSANYDFDASLKFGDDVTSFSLVGILDSL